MSKAFQKKPTDSRLHLAICQPALPHYRVPVFNLLGAQPGIALTVFAEAPRAGLHSAGKIQHFRYIPVRSLSFNVLGHRMIFMAQQISAVFSKKFDLVILTWDTHYLSLPPALLLGRMVNKPVVLWGHGYSKRRGIFRDWLRNEITRLASGVLFYTRTPARNLESKLRVPPARVFVAQNALNQSRIQAVRTRLLINPSTLILFQKQQGIDPAATILFVSRLQETNRVDLLIEGMALLLKSKPTAKLVIIGDGPDRAKLETLAHRLGVAESIRFTGAIYDEEKLAPWMLSASLFCYPKEIGLSVLHAFGYGLPVVTGDSIATHNPEIEALIPGVSGLLFRDADVADMVDQWERILDDPALRRRLSEGALRQVREKYTLENMVQGFLDTLCMVDGRPHTVVPEGCEIDLPRRPCA